MLTMTSSTPNHSGQATNMLELSKEYFVMGDDDDLSTTSRSSMSDDDSLSDNDSLYEDNEMDISEVQILPKRSRSTQSLSALSAQKRQQQTQVRSTQRQRMLARHSSVRNIGAFKRAAEVKVVQTVSATASSPGDETPNDYLCKILETKLDRVPFDGLGEYFVQTTPEHIAAWDGDLLRAVRMQDLARIKKMHEQGKPLQACNQFSESILHVAVRRGSPEILNYLLRHGQVSPRVRCDYGRTPLHDAYWTFDGSERSLKIVALLLKQCPEMLLVTDKRGFTPLDYVPRDRWEACCKFLDRCMPLLIKLKNNGRSGAAA